MIKRKLLGGLVLCILSLAMFGILFSRTLPAQAQPIDPPHPSSYPVDQSAKLNFIHVRYTPQEYSRRRLTLPSDNTSAMLYNNGPIVQALTAYTIFWDPNNNISSTYQSLINRYFTDVGHTNFYNIATQYNQASPSFFVSSNSSFGATYHDMTHAYPGNRGTGANPLLDSDIQNEVSAAIAANGWPNGGYGVEFFVFTERGIESCADALNCTIGASPPKYCAYHGSFGTVANPFLYANMPYVATWDSGFAAGSCATSVFNTPPNNHDADEEIDITSHEHMETVTDPIFYTDGSGAHGGWYDSGGWEIGDKCAYFFGPQAGNGSNVTLNGNPYLIQEEWSNVDTNGALHGGCSLNYSVDTRMLMLGPTTISAGQKITYTLTITNSGPKPANGLILSDTVPTHTTFVSLAQNSGPTFTCSTPAQGGTGIINCALNTLTNGGTAKWTLVLNVNSNTGSGTTVTNIAAISESATDSNSSNNSGYVGTSVGVPTAVTLSSFVVTSINRSNLDVAPIFGMGAMGGILLTIPLGLVWYSRKRRR